ncbi:type II toxin-antitoxin system YafQ family toxin [Scytonema sp. UIC 10036]|uniref:type II toxin-antitoxin system YafQ family toxin n=1 Tax=Scytonema sp. UIC 10036 TaxID=2304196 RepID=UPI001FA9C938|nr:type II toxin-antitoxin system YafQ family toxin [Scytonema sp. UIC 10036]
MQSKPSPLQIALTPRFKKDLRELAKRYRSIRSDLQQSMNTLFFVVNKISYELPLRFIRWINFYFAVVS